MDACSFRCALTHPLVSYRKVNSCDVRPSLGASLIPVWRGGGGALSRLVNLLRELLLNQSVFSKRLKFILNTRMKLFFLFI